MKTNLKYQIAFVALIAGFGLTSFSAEAQHKDSNRGNKKEYKYDKKKSSDRNDYNGNREYRADKNDRAYSYDYGHNDRYRTVYHAHADRRYDDSRYVYHHPKYGNVYRQFYSEPIRLNYAQGNLFYHHGDYYRFYPRVGYVRVAVPMEYVFNTLPNGYQRVYVDGRMYYRVDDMFLESCHSGYRIAPQFSVSFSANF